MISSIRGWDEVISEVPRRPVMQTPVQHHIKLVLNPLMDIQSVELVVKYCFQSTIIFDNSITDNSSGRVHHPCSLLLIVCSDIA